MRKGIYKSKHKNLGERYVFPHISEGNNPADSLQNCENIDFCCSRHPDTPCVVLRYDSSPSKLVYGGHLSKLLLGIDVLLKSYKNTCKNQGKFQCRYFLWRRSGWIKHVKREINEKSLWHTYSFFCFRIQYNAID